MEDLPSDVERKKEALELTRIYNRATGAGVDHHFIEQMGIMEETELILALQIMG